MKFWLPHRAVPATASENSGNRVDSAFVRATLQRFKKDTFWKKFALATVLLFGCVYAAVLSGYGHDCSVSAISSYDSEAAAGAYCKVAAWFSSFSPSSASWQRGDYISSTWGPGRNASRGRMGTSVDRIVFGIGVNAKSWADRREYVKLWWKPGVTRGFVWADEALDSWQEGDPPFKVSEDTSRFGYTHVMNARSALRIARIVAESYRLDLSGVDWFVMGDDDTLFFTENLVRVLGTYDATKLHYIGKNSEDSRQSERHHYGLAFGGGGFAISYPLAKALAETLDGCMERYAGLYGSDERVKACVSELGVPLTKEPGFHQLDVRGDISGLLAAHPVAPIVSLHHLDEIEPLFPGTTHLEAAKRVMRAVRVNSAGTFQQSICYDQARRWSFSVAWGYVVEAYEGFLTPRDLEMPATTFVSWAGRNEFGAFTMDTRPVGDVCGRPTRFFMVDAATKGSGSAMVGTSSYSRLKEFEGCKAKAAPLDTVRTVTVENDPIPDGWYRNPRRQCCTVKEMDALSISIHVGACGESESLVVGPKKTRRMLDSLHLYIA